MWYKIKNLGALYMKKFGFTLAEIMIALSIVGVMAAVVGPAITNLAPDKNKVIYLDYFLLTILFYPLFLYQ